MLTALTCSVLAIYCIQAAEPQTPAPASNEANVSVEAGTVFERINAARAARLGVKVTERRNRVPHAPAADLQPMTYAMMLNGLATEVRGCGRRGLRRTID